MPKSEKQFQKIRDKRKKQIMQAALKLFAKKGFHNTSVREISEKLHISSGLMYNYFKSKNDLLDAIIENLFDIYNEIAIEININKKPDKILKQIIISSFNIFDSNIEFWKLYMSLLFQIDVFKRYRKKFNDLLKEFSNLLVNIFKQKKLKQPEIEAKFFMAVLDGIQFHYLYDPKNYPLEKMKNYLIKRYCD